MLSCFINLWTFGSQANYFSDGSALYPHRVYLHVLQELVFVARSKEIKLLGASISIIQGEYSNTFEVLDKVRYHTSVVGLLNIKY